MASLSGKTALITGALGTIGRALVARFQQEGASVIALDLPGLDGEAVLSAAAGNVRYCGCDLGDLVETEQTVGKLAQDVGGIDILINNAALITNRPHEDYTIAEYEKEIRINSSAAFVVSRVCSAHMKEVRSGKIICLTSLTLNGQWDGFVPYVASKGAMYGLIKSLARELGRHGVNVNGISPGAVLSDAEWKLFGDRREAYHQWILDHQCLKRRIEAVDVANLAVFLSSPQADLISGQNISCDGGW
ncbi:SDR family oxidoreductase [Rhizobium leguminosarum]|uniref:SDR family oxidoreductase n=1 Tax=Rhizobium TaxID=379 RepID=UPI001C94A79A|nr:SDR family oxidoreductase [Rhizobium leguminosarum]MBY5392862.1 SDR family oxidoreductase [Rhizobium leguminosarum]MBY5434470.1 SDR family oxidoreductase [Rhizobium leguminosarum]